MILRVEKESERRERQRRPHRVFVLAKKLEGEYGDLWVICRFLWRKWQSGDGYLYDVGDGVWRAPLVVYY